jgi:hypothetical protein
MHQQKGPLPIPKRLMSVVADLWILQFYQNVLIIPLTSFSKGELLILKTFSFRKEI